MQFTLDADRNYSLQSNLPFEIRLQDIDFNYFARQINGSDMLVQQIVTNNSETVIDLRSYIDLPDNERLEQTISHLEPGRPVLKTFFIRDANQWLGRYIRIGLDDPSGTRRINYLLQIN